MNAPTQAPILSWHAHVYFDATSREAAWALRGAADAALAGQVQMGRFHEKPVGPHPMWSYQLAFPPAHFAAMLGWLTLSASGKPIPYFFGLHLPALAARLNRAGEKDRTKVRGQTGGGADDVTALRGELAELKLQVAALAAAPRGPG